MDEYIVHMISWAKRPPPSIRKDVGTTPFGTLPFECAQVGPTRQGWTFHVGPFGQLTQMTFQSYRVEKQTTGRGLVVFLRLISSRRSVLPT